MPWYVRMMPKLVTALKPVLILLLALLLLTCLLPLCLLLATIELLQIVTALILVMFPVRFSIAAYEGHRDLFKSMIGYVEQLLWQPINWIFLIKIFKLEVGIIDGKAGSKNTGKIE